MKNKFRLLTAVVCTFAVMVSSVLPAGALTFKPTVKDDEGKLKELKLY